ncbi:Uncharacterised protein [Vibrio cholerae]|nr:Uncharacterised protein [Vibrio cholerae]
MKLSQRFQRSTKFCIPEISYWRKVRSSAAIRLIAKALRSIRLWPVTSARLIQG